MFGSSNKSSNLQSPFCNFSSNVEEIIDEVPGKKD